MGKFMTSAASASVAYAYQMVTGEGNGTIILFSQPLNTKIANAGLVFLGTLTAEYLDHYVLGYITGDTNITKLLKQAVPSVVAGSAVYVANEYFASQVPGSFTSAGKTPSLNVAAIGAGSALAGRILMDWIHAEGLL